MTVDPRDFLLNTDYEMDQIIYCETGTITAGNANATAHNLSFTPLVFGVFATDADFTDTHPLTFTSQDGEQFTLSADGTNINISYDNQDPTASVYYCVFGFEPDGSTADTPATSQYAKSLVLNTDYNYCKLYAKGHVDGDQDTTVTHNLGYLPQIMAWTELNGYFAPITTSSIEVTDTQINFNYAGAGYDNIHYRIYYDEAI